MNIHEPCTRILDADIALSMLKEGNIRYTSDHLIAKDSYANDRESFKDAQNPFAVILACSDSRVAPEILFDQKLGDIFVIRNAGNIAETITQGSIEYAVEYLKTPLVVVLGHSNCGAVTAVGQNVEGSVHINSILNHIRQHCDGHTPIDTAIEQNVMGNVNILRQNDVLKKMKTKVIGAKYNIATGLVKFL